MSDYAVVTSFSQEGRKLYGDRFIETFLAFWPETVPLVVYTEGGDLMDEDFGQRVLVLNLDEDEDRAAFLKRAVPNTKDYRWQVKRFCHKVFAMTHVPKEVGWWVWLDADVVTEKPVPLPVLETLCPDGAVCSYLGRSEWHHSECGWLAVNCRTAAGPAILREMRRIYTSGEVFEHDEWHDSWIFDRVREQFEANGQRFCNLSPDAKGLDAWGASPLALHMRHLKGAEKFAA